jgi:ubiquinone/menaquinone biosynthesis C-methylase UbiE
VNRFENWICSTSFWRGVTRKTVLPWLLSGVELGDHVLEIGAGAGAATEELRSRVDRVTSLEYSRELVVKLASRSSLRIAGSSSNGGVLQGDASALPFPAKTFSAVIAVLMLHHLKSREVQDATFTEVFRVLRPGGIFVALDIPDGWLNRIAHIRSTFVPVAPSTASRRLADAGFSNVSLAFRRAHFRLLASRARDDAHL